MADALARRDSAGEKSPVGTMTAADWFRFLERYVEADNKVKAATNARKDLRKSIEGKLGDPELMEAFDRARKNRDVSGELRSKRDAAYFQFMAWDHKPLNFQGGLDIPLTTADAARVDLEGLEAGKAKHNREENPYTPGTDGFARWDTAWLRGQAQIASTLTDDPAKRAATLGVINGGKAAEGEQPKARRGRPPGSGKNQRAAAGAGEEQKTPDQGEGGDTGEQHQQGDDPAEGGQPQGDPQADTGGTGEDQGAAASTDRYGEEWPSTNGNGTSTLQ
jgi:hypothetical protein